MSYNQFQKLMTILNEAADIGMVLSCGLIAASIVLLVAALSALAFAASAARTCIQLRRRAEHDLADARALLCEVKALRFNMGEPLEPRTVREDAVRPALRLAASA